MDFDVFAICVARASEEISFYQGSSRERHTINSTFMELVDHLRDFILFRFSMGFIDTVIAKCEWVWLEALIRFTQSICK